MQSEIGNFCEILIFNFFFILKMFKQFHESELSQN